MQIDGHKLVALSFNPDTPGSPIILLHGITGSVGFWTPDQRSVFESHGPCYALSLPGHFPAAFPPGFRQESLTAEMMAHVLTAGIRELVGNQPVILVGYSTGGFAVLAVAALAPAVPRCAISISGFASGQWTGALGRFQRWVRRGSIGRLLFKLIYRSCRWPRAWFRASLRIHAADPHRFLAYPHLDAIVDGSLSNFRQLDLDAMAQYFAVMPDIDIEPLLTRITAPTLVLAGTNDPTVPPAQSHLIAENVPHAELAMLEEVGHVPMCEDHLAFRQVVGDWLQRQLKQVA